MFYGWLGSLVVLGGSQVIARNLIDRATTGSRLTAVIVGVAGMLPWMAVSSIAARRGDEFIRRIYATALAIAFCGAFLLVVVLDWLVKAQFIRPPDLTLVWVAFLLLWLIAALVAKRRFERGA